MINVSFNGATFQIPQYGDVNWADQLTAYFVALANGALSKAGGSFTLANDVDFGSSYGLVTSYVKSRSSNAAQSGVVRLANNDIISFRNSTNTADLSLALSGDNLMFGGSPVGVPLTTLGDLVYGASGGTPTRLPGNTTNDRKVLTQTGTGTVSAAPAWGDDPAGATQYGRVKGSNVPASVSGGVPAAGNIGYSRTILITSQTTFSTSGSTVQTKDITGSDITSLPIGRYLITYNFNVRLNYNFPSNLAGLRLALFDSSNNMIANTQTYSDGDSGYLNRHDKTFILDNTTVQDYKLRADFADVLSGTGTVTAAMGGSSYGGGFSGGDERCMITIVQI